MHSEFSPSHSKNIHLHMHTHKENHGNLIVDQIITLSVVSFFYGILYKKSEVGNWISQKKKKMKNISSYLIILA